MAFKNTDIVTVSPYECSYASFTNYTDPMQLCLYNQENMFPSLCYLRGCRQVCSSLLQLTVVHRKCHELEHLPHPSPQPNICCLAGGERVEIELCFEANPAETGCLPAVSLS